MHLESRPVRLAETIKDVCGLLGTAAEKNRVDLTMLVDPNTPATVVGDKLRLRQMLPSQSVTCWHA